MGAGHPAPMLIFLRHNLVFLPASKTGTTAVEGALRPHCSIEVRNPPRLRHMNVRRFRREWRPFLQEAYGFDGETVSVLREPLSWLESWYRYRGRDQIKSTNRSTAGMSFDHFVEQVLQDEPPPFADVGSQFFFATSNTDEIEIDHLFVYEQFDRVVAFLEARLGQTLKLSEANVSPSRSARLSPDLEAELRRKWAKEFTLYARIAEAGHLQAKGTAGC